MVFFVCLFLVDLVDVYFYQVWVIWGGRSRVGQVHFTFLGCAILLGFVIFLGGTQYL